MTTKDKFLNLDLSAEAQCPSTVCTKHSVATPSLQGKDSPTPYDLDGALVEAAEELKFDWPEYLPTERIKTGIMEIALGLFLFAALVAFCCFG